MAQQSQLAPLKKLNNGVEIPVAGLGMYKTTDGQNIEQLIGTALDLGYRYFDTAIMYENEEIFGQALQNIFKKGKYKREDIFILSKCFPHKNHSVQESVEQSLKKLQTSYIDLYLLHWPCFAPDANNNILHRPVHQCYQELEDCYDKKWVRSIGVSNYNVQLLFDLLSYARIKPVMNQVELHVYFQQPGLLKFCKQFDVAITAYCPLGRGGKMFEDPIILKLAQKYSKTPAQVMLNFLCLELDTIVIPKTEKIARLQENFDWRDFRFTEEEVKELIAIDQKFRLIDPTTREFLGYLPLFD